MKKTINVLFLILLVSIPLLTCAFDLIIPSSWFEEPTAEVSDAEIKPAEEDLSQESEHAENMVLSPNEALFMNQDSIMAICAALIGILIMFLAMLPTISRS